MNRLQKAAVLSLLITKMRENGSWCGETHIQKASFFLQHLLNVPLGFEFILYKHGPYSFDLTRELTALRADAILDLQVLNDQYGPSYIPGKLQDYLRSRFPKTMERYEEETSFIASRLGCKGVKELERLATALFVREEGKKSDSEAVKRITQLKPHISEWEARAAVDEVNGMMSNRQSST